MRAGTRAPPRSVHRLAASHAPRLPWDGADLRPQPDAGDRIGLSRQGWSAGPWVHPGGLYTIGHVIRTPLVMSLLARFAGNVRRLRSKKGLSRKVLADSIGISVSYVSMLERGQRSPPLETIEKMARALKVTPAALLGGR